MTNPTTPRATLIEAMDPYLEGYDAHANGTAYAANPYEWASTASSRQWRQGWLDSEQVDRRDLLAAPNE